MNGESDLDASLSLQLLNEALLSEKMSSAQANLSDKEDCITIDETSVTRVVEVTLAALGADLKWPHAEGTCPAKNGPGQAAADHSARGEHDDNPDSIADLNVDTIVNAVLNPDVISLIVSSLIARE